MYIPFVLIMCSRPPRMAPSPRHSGVRRISGLIPDSTVQVRVGTHGSSSGPTHDPSPHDRLSSFSIHYTNIRGLNSNFSSVESHLATSSPKLFLLSETQLSSQSSPDPFQISHYNLYSRFRSKGGVCAYCNINTPIARLMDLESTHFDVLRLKIYLPTTTIFLCFCYCSPNATNNLFGSYFSANSSLSDSNAPDPPTQPLSNPIPSIIISARKVHRVLRSLKTDKASGPDGIPPRFLKEFADELAPVLCRLFRLILISCTYPSSWKHALVQPVPKKGDHSNPSNYRPIALTSAVAKVFETWLNSHFIKHLESNNLLSDHQYGFRKARSIGDLLSYLTHVWSSSLKNFGESFVVALDISKAFDRVWHKALLAKLPAYGFTPSFCKLISSFLSNRFISVVVDGATSASFPVSSGVPQGPVLSPTLFLLFINDLLHATASDVHSFADDSNLHKSSSFQCQPSSNARSQSRLAMSSTINSDLQSISEWGTRNLVKFNTSKTQLLTISLSNTPSNYPIIFEDSEIPSLNSVNILGLQISSSLSWRDHIVQIAKSASKKLGVLFRCKQYFNSAQLFKLYTGFIRPCLEYCSHIWGSSPYTSLLDRIESKAIRLIGNPSLTSTLDPLSLQRKVASLSLFYRHYFGHCSDELATCIPPPMARPRSTRQATLAHNYCVELSNARINRFSDGFFPSTSHLWNSLPSSVFPASFNLPSFKRQVYHHLRGQMA